MRNVLINILAVVGESGFVIVTAPVYALKSIGVVFCGSIERHCILIKVHFSTRRVFGVLYVSKGPSALSTSIQIVFNVIMETIKNRSPRSDGYTTIKGSCRYDFKVFVLIAQLTRNNAQKFIVCGSRVRSETHQTVRSGQSSHTIVVVEQVVLQTLRANIEILVIFYSLAAFLVYAVLGVFCVSLLEHFVCLAEYALLVFVELLTARELLFVLVLQFNAV